MKSLSLDAGQRTQLLDVLGQQTGKLVTLAPYWRVMEKLRISEAEATELSLRVEPSGERSLVLWDPAVPLKKFKVEDSDAVALRACLEEWPHWQSGQVPALQKLLDQLK